MSIGTETARSGSQVLRGSALAFTALTVPGAVLGGSSGLRPDSPPAEVLAATAAGGTAMALGSALLLLSAAALVVLAAALRDRLRALGVEGPWPAAALAGAEVAAAAIAASAATTWTAVQTAGLGEPALAAALATLWFATGGPGFVAPFGLLLLGLALPALAHRLLPRALAWAALVVGALAVLSALGFATAALHPLLPLARFAGLLVLIAAAFLLPTREVAR